MVLHVGASARILATVLFIALVLSFSPAAMADCWRLPSAACSGSLRGEPCRGAKVLISMGKATNFG